MVPQVWIDKTQAEIAKLLADYPALGNEGNAFNVWALMRLHDLTEDEALESTASRLRGPGDAGIDAIVSDDLSQVLYLTQTKYSANLSGSFDETAAQELLAGLDLLMSDEYARSAGSDFMAAREQLLGTLAGGSDVVLEVIVGGKMTSEGRTRVEAYVDGLDDDQIRLDVLDIEYFWSLHQDRSEGSDLSGEWLEFATVGEALAIPSSAQGLSRAEVVVLDAASLIPAVSQYGRRLVANNLRHLLKRSRINDAIADSTASSDLRTKFPLLNNGLTITCEALESFDGGVKLKNPQIVNGGQTTMTLFMNRSNFGPSQIFLIARIVATEPGEEGRILALDIAESTNRQNPITPADLKANDDRQKTIQASLAAATPAWFYERRRNERASLPPGRLASYAGVITKEDLGQRWRAFSGQPAAAITGKQAMFVQQDLYGDTFSLDVDVRLYVLAHQLFEFYYDMLGSSEAAAKMRDVFISNMTELERVELVRARNQFAAHCAAATAHLLRATYGDISVSVASRLTDELRGSLRGGSGAFSGTVRLVLVSIHKWFKDKKFAAHESGSILAVKAEFEKSQTLKSVVSEMETYRALVGMLADYAMPDE